MVAGKQVNRRKEAIFSWTATGLGLFAVLHWFVGLLIDGAQLDATRFDFILVLPVSVIVSGLSIALVVRHPGFVATTSGMAVGNWFAVVVLLLVGSFAVYASAGTYNIALDGGETAQHTVVETGRYFREGRRSRGYFVSVVDEDDPYKRQTDFHVSSAFYYGVYSGEKLRATYHKGAFGFPWLSGLTVIPRAGDH